MCAPAGQEIVPANTADETSLTDIQPANQNNPGAMLPGNTGLNVTPAEFLKAIFGPQTLDAWVCSNDQSNPKPDWSGGRFRNTALSPDRDAYFSIGLLGPGETRRSSDGVCRHFVVFADDVGTKVAPAKWEEFFAQGFPRPVADVETSPGNHTYIWRIGTPVEKDDEEEMKALRAVRAALGSLGLSDPLPDDARYIRLPWGVNGKPKYTRAGGSHPRVRLTEWNPDNTLDLEQAATILLGSDWKDKADALGVTGTSHAGALHRTADMNNPEPIIQLARELGLNPVQVRPGVVEAMCPNHTAHSDRADTGFAFLGNGLMECNHASCQGLKTPDFTRLMCEAYDARQNGLVAVGLPATGPETAGEFLAARAFEYHDRNVGQTAGQLDQEAERLAIASDTAAKEAEQTRQAFAAAQIGPVQPFTPSQIPPRPFLYGNVVLAGYVSGVVATGGTGKSLVLMARAVAMATGLELIAGEKPLHPMTVWYHNAEDDLHEQQRRLYAVLDHHGLQHGDLGGRLILTTNETLPARLARMGRDGPEAVPAVADGIVDTAKRLGAQVIMFDPLGAMHGLPENANEAMNFLAGILRDISRRAGVAIVIAHHTGKAATQDMDTAGAHASRGASAITDALRVVEQLRGMNAKEAGDFGVTEEDRQRIMWIGNGKANFTPQAAVRWMRRVPIKLGNSTPEYPAGDEAPTVEGWTPRKKATGTASDLALVQNAIAAAPTLPRYDMRAANWIGRLVADTLGLDIGRPGLPPKERNREQAAAHARVRDMVEGWLAGGGLVKRKERDPDTRHDHVCVAGGTPAIIAEPADDDGGQ